MRRHAFEAGSLFIVVGAVAAAIAINPFAGASSRATPGTVERPFPALTDARTAYPALARPAGPDDQLPHASADALVRRLHPGGAPQDVFLTLKGNDICIVAVQRGDDAGGTTCTAATGTDSHPPILLLGHGDGKTEHVRVFGAVPDGIGITGVDIVAADGGAHRVEVAGGTFFTELNTPAQSERTSPVRSLKLIWSDGATTDIGG